MMLNWLHKARGLRFFEADGGGKSGSGANGDSPGSGQGDKIDVEALFKVLPLEELDEPTRKKFEDAKTKLGVSVATLQSNLEKTVQQSRDFQSQKDQFQRQLEEATKKGAPPKEDEYLEAVKAVMRKNGFAEDAVAKQAPVFAEMLQSASGLVRKEVGQGLQPMAKTVIEQAARDAFTEAQDKDDDGCLGIPEVAQKVWKLVQERIEQGATTNSQVVLNLAKMAYVDHLGELRSAGKEAPVLKPRSGGSEMRTGTTFNYPGSGGSGGMVPIVTAPADPNRAKHALNGDTEAALSSTMKEMTRGFELKNKPPVLVGK